MIDPKEVSAVLVTRGDVEMGAIIDSIRAAGVEDIVVWDNAQRPVDLQCYGRYVAINEARHEIIYHQDDDLIAPVAEILAAYDPVADCNSIVANNRADEEWRLTAMGVVFRRGLAHCFDEYIARYGFDDDFCRICDVVFAYQHEYRRIVLGYTDLPWQTAPNSMYLQPGHMEVRERALQRTLELPVGVAA